MLKRKALCITKIKSDHFVCDVPCEVAYHPHYTTISSSQNLHLSSSWRLHEFGPTYEHTSLVVVLCTRERWCLGLYITQVTHAASGKKKLQL